MHTSISLAGAAAGLAVTVATAAATVQAPIGQIVPGATPVVDVRAGDAGVQVSASQELRPGPLELSLSAHSASSPQTLSILRLREGASPDAVAATETHGLADVRALERSATLVSGAIVRPGARFRSTIVATAGRYLVVNYSDERHRYALFSVAGSPRGDLQLPAAPHLRIRDHGYDLPARLERRGLLRVHNAGTRPHHVLAIRIKRGLGDVAAMRRARRGGDLRRIGTPQELLGLVSAGTVNLVDYHLKPGRWLLVSYYGTLLPRTRPDAQRGLIEIVRVR